MSEDIFLLGKWLEQADYTYATSKKLMYEALSKKESLHIAVYLLHLSIELYLKAFLMDRNAFERGHSLIILFDKSVSIDFKLSNLCPQSSDDMVNQRNWIEYVEPFGQDGGLRYLNSKRPKWSFSVITYDFFDDMIEHIKKNTNHNKNITSFI